MSLTVDLMIELTAEIAKLKQRTWSVAGMVLIGRLDIFSSILTITLHGSVLFEYVLAPQRNIPLMCNSHQQYYPYSYFVCIHALFPFDEFGELSLPAIGNLVQEMLGKAVENFWMNREVFSHSLRHFETILTSFFPPLSTFDEAITSSLCLYSTINRFVVESSSQTALGEGYVSERMILVVVDTLAPTTKTALNTTVHFVTRL
ncbi:hypothetical protein BLNAU_6627 [Blattamonas nauphoetae]|uniref:Uncharacterized protein n=1 Tax=Blattamonas nauphoetae TaxID=2049346 RepID=A0ABQ9Y3M2_9EUKA|nr:hypothetical protein BLNAU_6627 [Blattamonas nauphoetae]